MIKTYLLPVLMVILFVGCSNNEVNTIFCETEDPANDLVWLNEIIQGAQENENNKTEIYQCKYKNNEGFLINTCIACVDSDATFHNCSGEIMCQIGGYGNLNTCPDFWDNITSYELLWSNK